MSELKAIWEFIVLLDHPMAFAMPLTVFLIMYHKPIGKWLSRRLENPDNSDKPKENTQPTEQSLPDTTSNLKDVDEELYFDPKLQPIFANEERSTWANIKAENSEKYPENRKNPIVKSLVKKLVMTRIQVDFETLYGAIHGSQIRLLRKINERGDSVPYNEIHAYFLETQKTFPMFYTDNIKTDDYLVYLLNNSLIIRQGESYNITERSAEFLAWMSKARINENKPW